MPEVTNTNDVLDKVEQVVEIHDESDKVVDKVPEATWVEIPENSEIPTSAEAQAHIDAINNWEIQEDKSLIEMIYEEWKEKELKEEAEKSIDDLLKWQELPEVNVSDIEKEKQVEAVVEDITKIVDKDISPEKVVEQLTEMFIEKEDALNMEITLKTKKISKLEEILEKQNEEINKLKYSDGKVDIVDDFMGALVTTYKDSKSNPQDVKTLTRLWQIHLLWLQKIYPELNPEDVTEMIKAKREANLKAIQWISESSDKNIVTETPNTQPTRNMPRGIIVG